MLFLSIQATLYPADETPHNSVLSQQRSSIERTHASLTSERRTDSTVNGSEVFFSEQEGTNASVSLSDILLEETTRQNATTHSEIRAALAVPIDFTDDIEETRQQTEREFLGVADPVTPLRRGGGAPSGEADVAVRAGGGRYGEADVTVPVTPLRADGGVIIPPRNSILSKDPIEVSEKYKR